MVKKGKFQRYPLFDAIQKKDLKRVRYLLETGDIPNAQNEEGRSALNFAIEEGNKKIVQLLLEKGADPNRRGSSENFPIFSALEKKNKDLLKLLLAYRADPYLQNEDGVTAYTLVQKSKSKALKELFGLNVEIKPYFLSKIDQEYYDYLIRTFSLSQLRDLGKKLSIVNYSILRKDELALAVITSFGKYLKETKIFREIFPFYFE